jgi:hypothetical protein
MTQDQALTVADDAIVSALSAVGEIMPASVRDHLMRRAIGAGSAASERSISRTSSARWTRRKSVMPHHESLFFDHDAPTLEDILEG